MKKLVYWIFPIILFPILSQASDLTSNKDPYYKVLKHHTRESQIYSTVDLHAQYIVYATYLSPDFRSSFKNIFKKYYPEGQDGLAEKRANLWSEDGGEVSFLVALYTKNRKMDQLGNPQSLWDLSLKLDSQVYKPKLVEKVLITPLEVKFFPFVNRWYHLYRVSFPVHSPAESDSLQLNLFSVIGHSELKF